MMRWASCLVVVCLSVGGGEAFVSPQVGTSPRALYHVPYKGSCRVRPHLMVSEQSLPNNNMATGGADASGPSSSNVYSSNDQVMASTSPVVSSSQDPIGYSLDQFKRMDTNEMINTGILLGIALFVLTKISLVDQGLMRGWTAGEIALRIPLDNWESYYDVLTESPIQTKAITSATVYAIGDVIAQRTEGCSIGELDRMRTLRSLLAGLIGHGPLSHYWYDLSESMFNDVLGWTQWWSFFPKVLVDQATWGPFWNNVYIILLGAMKRDTLQNIWSDIKRTTIPLVVSGLKLWPLAHCVTYGLVPVENRLLWVDIVEILWVTILATQAAGGGAEQEAAAPVNANNDAAEGESELATEKQ